MGNQYLKTLPKGFRTPGAFLIVTVDKGIFISGSSHQLLVPGLRTRILVIVDMKLEFGGSMMKVETPYEWEQVAES